ncbi:hypothetical protein CC2G_010542 [Coprinopsis cinerea AmutBmut pab1-1]|nr:hypothetical protein CC2G_010542 [Coprinopsis cinerea AmutBmut pab1-1]
MWFNVALSRSAIKLADDMTQVSMAWNSHGKLCYRRPRAQAPQTITGSAWSTLMSSVSNPRLVQHTWLSPYLKIDKYTPLRHIQWKLTWAQQTGTERQTLF